MTQLTLQCSNCLRIFPSGFCIENSSVTFHNCASSCPFCGSVQSIPDGIFRDTVEGFIEFFKDSGNPLKNASELFEALQKSTTAKDLKEIKNSKQFKKLRKWIPDTPEKIAAYLAIAYTLIQFFTKSPTASINYNSFVDQYNQIVIEIKK